MSIRESAFELRRAVKASPSMNDLRQLLVSLSSTSKADMDTERDRSWWEYMTRSLHAQFLAYLVVDAQRTELEKKKGPSLPPLTERERGLLAAAHKQMLELNLRCIAPLIAVLPMCSKAVDPYSRFTFPIPSEVPGVELLSRKAIEAMARSFHTHPAMVIALESAKSFVKNIREADCVSMVSRLTKELTQAGPANVPVEITRNVIAETPDSMIRITVRHIATLTCIRASLATLNELVMLAVARNKLHVVDEDHLVDIEQLSNIVSRGGNIIYQMSDKLGSLTGWNLFWIKCLTLQEPIDELCSIEGWVMDFSDDTVRVDYRSIDENLNPYSNLLKHL